MKILQNQVRPITAVVKVPVLARGDEMITETGVIRHVIDAAQQIEAGKGGLAAACFGAIHSPTFQN